MLDTDNMETNLPDRPHGMLRSELELLAELVRSSGAERVLEIGMANASSAVAILSSLPKSDFAHLTSIDPFQLSPVNPTDGGIGGYGGEGVRQVASAGFASKHTLLAELDYVALPKLVAEGATFDFIFIDGYHSFDHTLLDFFYADRLLKVGGTVAFHDSARLPVYKVCTFVATYKPYKMIGPPLALTYRSLAKRILRRAWFAASGQESAFRQRRERWKSLAAFVKQGDAMAPEYELADRAGS